MDTKLLAQRNSARIARLTDVSMPIIYSATLESPVNAITISTDNLGAEFDLKRAELVFLVPAGSSVATGSAAYVCGQVNGITSGYIERFLGSENAGNLNWGTVRNVWAEVKVDLIVVCSTGLYSDVSSYYSDGTNRGAATSQGGLASGISSISSLHLWLASGYTFPAGTMIELRGQKA